MATVGDFSALLTPIELGQTWRGEMAQATLIGDDSGKIWLRCRRHFFVTTRPSLSRLLIAASELLQRWPARSLRAARRYTRRELFRTSHKHGPRPNAEQFKNNRKDGLWLWHCFGDCKRGRDVLGLVKELSGYGNAGVRFWFAEKFGSSWLLVANPIRSELKLAAVKQDANPVVLKSAKTTSGGFDGLDAAVEPFGHGVRDPLPEVV